MYHDNHEILYHNIIIRITIIVASLVCTCVCMCVYVWCVHTYVQYIDIHMHLY